MDLIIDFLNFLQPYGTLSYFVMFAVLLLCGLGLPMPEDIVLVTGGILASRGITDFWVTNFVCLAGVLIGDGFVLTIGKTFGPRVKETWLFRRLITPKLDEKVQSVFLKWGDKVVFLARFMPGLRTPIFLTAGIYKTSYAKFLVLDGSAALISVPVWIWIGELFGGNLELLYKKMKQFQVGILVAVVVIVVLLFVRNRILSRLKVPAA